MASLLSSILRGVNRTHNKLNILCANLNESFQFELAKTGHNFFFVTHPNIQGWRENIRPLPENCRILVGNDLSAQLKQDLQFDLVLSQSRDKQHPLLVQIARQLSCPMVSVGYHFSDPQQNPYYIESLSYQEYNHSVFGSEFLTNSWGFDSDEDDIDIIPHGIDTEFFSGWGGGDQKVLTVVNQYPNRDNLTGFSLLKQLADGLPLNPWGDSPGFSKPTHNRLELLSIYQKASVFLNTSVWKACPLPLLEAMSVGCPVVTTSTSIISDFVEDGVNGYISNDPEKLKEYILELLNDKDKAKELGQNARQTIIDQFSLDPFLAQWNSVFEKTIDKVSCALR